MNYPTFIGHDFTAAQLIRAAVVPLVLVPGAPVAFVQCSRARRPALRDRFASPYDRDFLAFVSAYRFPASSIAVLKNTLAPINLHENRIRRRVRTGLSVAGRG